jgi:hypothetical protein
MANEGNRAAWKPATEAGSYLPAILLFYLLVYSAAYTTRYAVTDDYLFLEAIRLHDPTAIAPLLLEGGRPLLAIIAIEIARFVDGIGDLSFVRAFGVTGIGGFAALVFYAFRRERQPLWLALAAALSVGLLPGFQVLAAWAVCAPYPYAAVLSGAAFLTISAGGAERAIVYRTAAAVLLLAAGLMIYQPAAMAFWCFAAIWALSQERVWNLRVLASTAVTFCCALVIDFGVSKALPAAFGLADDFSRTALTHSPLRKLVWFITEPLSNAANLYVISPSAPVSAAVGAAILAGVFVKYGKRGGAYALLIALLLVLAYVPNLLVSEDWASYRTTPALAGVVLIAALILVVRPFDQWIRSPRFGLAVLPLLIAPAALSASFNVAQTYAFPSRAEYLLLRSALVRALHQIPHGGAPKTVCVVPAHWQSTLSPISRYDEFGVVSSSIPEVLQAIVGGIAASAPPARQRPGVVFRVVGVGAPLAGCDARLAVDRLLLDAQPGGVMTQPLPARWR